MPAKVEYTLNFLFVALCNPLAFSVPASERAVTGEASSILDLGNCNQPASSAKNSTECLGSRASVRFSDVVQTDIDNTCKCMMSLSDYQWAGCPQSFMFHLSLIVLGLSSDSEKCSFAVAVVRGAGWLASK